jgi:hypothetical protein
MFDERGREVPDDRPVAVPAGWRAPESLPDMIRRFVQREISARAEAVGLETFEESDDFEVDDEAPDPLSAYEVSELREDVAPLDDPEAAKARLAEIERWVSEQRARILGSAPTAPAPETSA